MVGSVEVEIFVSDPIVVSRAPVSLGDNSGNPGSVANGKWQFPAIGQLPGGKIVVGYHVEADLARNYGKPEGKSVSNDNGRTWKKGGPEDVAPSWTTQILVLPNGDLLRQIPLRSVDPKSVETKLPPPVIETACSTGEKITVFLDEKFPPELKGYRLARCRAGSREWVEETATVKVPGEIRYIITDPSTRGSEPEGVLVFPWFQRIKLAPDGSLWGIGAFRRIVENKLQEYSITLFIRSVDGGRRWDFLSEILYQPDLSADPFADKRDGFTEPNITFLPDGSVFCLMRTTDGNGTGPLYASYSNDNGKSWSRPVVFDDLGVWPALVTLKSGITLASYGRPALYVRATADPSGKTWGKRVAISLSFDTPGDPSTCAYSDLLAMGDNELLIVYSDFRYPDSKGRSRKTILVRRLECKSIR